MYEFRSERNPYEVRIAAKFEDHGTAVWRVSWNITGTILSSSGDDGCVRLWKGMLLYIGKISLWKFSFTFFLSANYLDTWKCISTLKGDEVLPTMMNENEESKGKKIATYYQYASTVSTHPNQYPWH